MDPDPSYWLESASRREFPRLEENVHVDVAVVGAGMVGITTAFLLARAGLSVALIEARRAAAQISGYTTAKVTSQHGRIYADLHARLGEEGARRYGESQQAALQGIAELVDELGIDCGFERAPAYTYCVDREHLPGLQQEAHVAAGLGLPAEYVTEAPAPFPLSGAVRFADQARFHPCRYLLGLLERLPGAGCRVFERTRVHNVREGSPCRVSTGRAELTAGQVVIATGLPILDRGGYFAATLPRAHAALAARVEESGELEGMYINVEQPTRSVRAHRDDEGVVLIATGGAYRTGQGEPMQACETLEQWLRAHFPVTAVVARWTNEDFDSVDRLPYVGPLSARSHSLWTATGFGAWGMTGGMLAGMILADRITGRDNRWASLYDSTRFHWLRSAPAFARHNLQVARQWIADRGGSGDRRNPEALEPGEAAVLQLGARQVAAYRAPQGKLYAVSAKCTHMGCRVSWNALSRTWDCPCHGSRFTPDGEVLYGPAVHPLGAVDPR